MGLTKSRKNITIFKFVKNTLLQLECPVCLKKIKSKRIFQCVNGHVICQNCIPWLEKCAICLDDSKPARNLIVKRIASNFEDLQPNQDSNSNQEPNSLDWKKRSTLTDNNDILAWPGGRGAPPINSIQFFLIFSVFVILCLIFVTGMIELDQNLLYKLLTYYLRNQTSKPIFWTDILLDRLT